MSRRRIRTGAELFGVLLLAATAAAPATEVRQLKGQSLAVAVQQLAADAELAVLFSDGLIPEYVVVTQEPPSRSPRQRLDQLLAVYGLRLAAGSGDQWIVVRPEAAGVGELSGVVADANGDPVVAAKVRLAPQGRSTTTGSGGQFFLGNLPAVTMGLIVEASGYKPLRLTVPAADVRSGRKKTIVLSADTSDLAPITVTASHYSLLRDTAPSLSVLSREEVDQTPHIADDVFRVTRWLPGVAGGDIGARINVRGGAEDELLVVLDGMRIYEPYHLRDLLSLFSVVDSNTIDGVDFYTGAFPVQYGGVNSGVLDIHSRTPDPEYPHRIGVSFTNAFVQTSGALPGGDGQWMVSGRTGYLDVVLDIIDDTSGLNPSFYDLLAKFDKDLAPSTRLTAGALVVGDNSLAEDDDGDFSDGDFLDVYAWANVDTDLSSSLAARLRLFGGRLDLDKTGAIDDGGRLQAAVSDDRTFSFLGVGGDFTFTSDRGDEYRFGVDVRTHDADYRYVGGSISRDLVTATRTPLPRIVQRDLDVAVQGESYALYGSAQWQLTSELTTELGARWDYQTYVGPIDDTQISPRASLRWQPFNNTALRLSWGRFYQPQEPNELQVADGVDTFFPAQAATHSVLALEHGAPGVLQWRLEAYRKDYSDVRPYFTNLFYLSDVLLELESDRERVSPDRARTRGIELSLRRQRPAGISWWATYVYSRAEERIDGSWRPRSWDQRHAASVGLKIPVQSWDVSLAWRYRSGWPVTAVGQARGLVNGIPATLPLVTERNNGRTGIFHRLDLRASREVPVPRGRLRIYVEALNVFNRRNECCTQFDFFLNADSEIFFVENPNEWLPFVPSLGIKWEF